MNSKKALAKAQKSPIKKPVRIPEAGRDLIAIAVDKDYDLDRLQKLIDMKDREEAKEAKRLFFLNFAAMQSELQPIVRNRSADKPGEGGAKESMYRYATIGAAQKQIQKTVSKHGFSYYWEKAKIDRETHWMTVGFVLCGWGYEKRNESEGPLLAPTQRQNALQALAGTETYLRRYAMWDGLGLASDDDDRDGAGVVQVEIVSEEAAPRKETKKLQEARAALNSTFILLADSRKFGDEELLKLKAQGKAIIADGDIEKVYALKTAWEKELAKKKGGSK